MLDNQLKCDVCRNYRCETTNSHTQLEKDKPRDLPQGTPYEKHARLSHAPMSRHSPDSFVIVEECDCGMRFLHNPNIGYPVTLR